MKKTILMFLAIINCFLLVSCEHDNIDSVENRHLYSTVVNNSLNFQIHSEAGASINVLETDSYGRILFYCQSPSGYILGVCQKSDDENVYFYEDSCVIEFRTSKYLTEKDESYLKKLNDWDCKLNEEKMTAKPIESTSNWRGRGINNNKAYETLTEFIETDYNSNFAGYEYVTSNESGMKLFFVIKYQHNTSAMYPNEGATEICYIIVLNEDGSFISDEYVLQLDDKYNYRDYLIAFKEKINWYDNSD